MDKITKLKEAVENLNTMVWVFQDGNDPDSISTVINLYQDDIDVVTTITEELKQTHGNLSISDFSKPNKK